MVVLDRFQRKERALNVRVLAELHRRIDVFCAQHDKTIKEFVTQALEEKLAREEGRVDTAPPGEQATQQ